MNSSSRGRLNDLVAEETAQHSPNPEDSAILNVASELYQELGIKNVPLTIVWAISRASRSPGFSPSSDFLAPDTILWSPSWLTLPKQMRGMLDPEDWRPLLASSL